MIFEKNHKKPTQTAAPAYRILFYKAKRRVGITQFPIR